jgi:hypothetical protein
MPSPNVTVLRRAPVRDKRYGKPALLVDLLEGAYRTPFWSPTQMIVRNLAQDLAPGARFSGAFQFDGARGCGLFEATVTRAVSERQLIGASFEWISLQGRALMDAFQGRQKRDALGGGPQMTVMLTRTTCNWSLSGMLIPSTGFGATVGGRVSGLLRLDKAQEPGPFTAGVIRQALEPETGQEMLALKFADLPPSTFSLLEGAIRKHPALLGSAA